MHWYRRGLSAIFTTPWTSTHDKVQHPDTGAQISGTVVDVRAIMDLAKSAHHKLCPHVPLVGWDVALTESHGMLLLEGNFSCNFFRGDFDQRAYFSIVDEYFSEFSCNK